MNTHTYTHEAGFSVREKARGEERERERGATREGFDDRGLDREKRGLTTERGWLRKRTAASGEGQYRCQVRETYTFVSASSTDNLLTHTQLSSHTLAHTLQTHRHTEGETGIPIGAASESAQSQCSLNTADQEDLQDTHSDGESVCVTDRMEREAKERSIHTCTHPILNTL